MHHSLHLDDNNRLYLEGEGRVVRTWLQLMDDSDSNRILREERDAPAPASRLSMPSNRQLVVDSERLWHAAWRPGKPPCNALITTFESDMALDRWNTSQWSQPQLMSR